MSVQAGAKDEIDKIMNEIEELQREMSEVTPQANPPKLQVVPTEAGGNGSEDHFMEEFHSTDDAPSMEETLGDLKEEESSGSSLLDQVGSTEEVQDIEEKGEVMSAPVNGHDYDTVEETPSSGKPGSLSMTLTGSMTLTLKYEYEGEEVVVGFTDHALKVQLSDGTEFKIPVRKKTKGKLKRVA